MEQPWAPSVFWAMRFVKSIDRLWPKLYSPYVIPSEKWTFASDVGEVLRSGGKLAWYTHEGTCAGTCRETTTFTIHVETSDPPLDP